MTTNTDQRQAREQRRHHPRPMAAILGEDLGPPLYTDDNAIPKSAQTHANRRRRADLEAANERRLALLDADAEIYADEQARQRVRDDLNRGRTPSQADQIRAARAVARDPATPKKSSAEQLAERYRRARGWR